MFLKFSWFTTNIQPAIESLTFTFNTFCNWFQSVQHIFNIAPYRHVLLLCWSIDDVVVVTYTKCNISLPLLIGLDSLPSYLRTLLSLCSLLAIKSTKNLSFETQFWFHNNFPQKEYIGCIGLFVYLFNKLVWWVKTHLVPVF